MGADPFATPDADLAGGSSSRSSEELGPTLFAVDPPKGGKWVASFHPEHLYVRNLAGDRELTYRRDELATLGSLVFMPGGAVGVTLRSDERIVVTVPASQQVELRKWIDPIADAMMRAPFAKSRASRGIFGVISVVFYLLDPTTFWLVFAAWNGLMFGASFVKPHRLLLLAQGLFSLGLCAYFGYGVYAHGTPWWILIVVFFVLVAALNSLRLYKFYGLDPNA
ncbi:MAG: hypothetical protein RMA76_04225 [Deltaproteobacteria bacterium]|jgi:hypothetical protein